MSVLPSWGTHRVYATYRSLTDGSWLAGTVTVSLPVDVHSVTDDAIIPKGRHINAQPLNTTTGLPSLDINVPASDDPDNLPQDFYVEITVQLNEPRVNYTYKIPTPLGGETNLRTILDPDSVTVDGPLFVGVAGGLARLSDDGTNVLDAQGNPISTGGGGTALTTYGQVSGLPDYPATFPADLSGTATSAQGEKADTAVQPDDLAPVATSGAYGDLTGTPTIPPAYDDTALSGRVDALEGAGYITAADVPAAPTWDTLSGKPAVIAAGTTAATARDAIEAQKAIPVYADNAAVIAALNAGQVAVGDIVGIEAP